MSYDIEKASDRALDIELTAHLDRTYGGDDEANRKEREEWVSERTSAIMADRDYHADLMVTLLESHEGDEITWAIRQASEATCVSAIAALDIALTRIARNIAEGEAMRRFG